MRILFFSISFIFFFLLPNKANSEEEIIPIHVYDIYGTFNSELTIGKNATSILFLEIDLQGEYSWTNYHYYNISSSTTIRQVNQEPFKLKVIDKEETAIIYEDFKIGRASCRERV